jgi:hypothetical protein
MLIDLNCYRDKKYPYITEEEVWNSLINLDPSKMMIITKVDGELRVVVVNNSRFEVNPEELVK